MKKIAVYLAYAPGQDLRNQGLGRLLAFILEGAKKSGTNVTLCYPKWYKTDLDNLLDDNKLERSDFEHITTGGVPFIIRVKMKLDEMAKRKKRKGFLKRIAESTAKSLGRIGLGMLSSSNPFIIILMLIAAVPVGIVAVPLFAVLGALFFILIKIPRRLKRVKIVRALFLPAKQYSRNDNILKVFSLVRKKELERLNRIVNKKKDIHSILIPTIFWPEITGLKMKKVVVVPDLIFMDFPTQFELILIKRAFMNIQDVIASADHYITYSEYVKKEHLQKRFNVPDESVSVVHHGRVSLSEHLEKETADDILKEYQKKKLQSDPYLADICLTELRFIFYSSQIRPHKNIMNLIKAYEILLRKRFINVKLVLTADLKNKPEEQYIKERGLSKDIITLFNVPSKVLAALNAKAVCAVNPTMFEGGFPFTFMEAYTVGTPSIMSDIPMTSELIEDGELKSKMLFDPCSVQQMADRIEYGVTQSDKLMKEQRELYEQLSKRTWQDAANDYIKVLENV